MTRSVMSIAAAALLIALTFASASLFSMSSTSLLALGLAIVGYNGGLLAYVAGGMLLGTDMFRSAR